MLNFFDFTLLKLSEYLANSGYKPFHAKQLFKWVYQKNCFDFTLMNDLPKELRAFLKNSFTLELLSPVSQVSAPDKTIKLLYRLSDGALIESVLMHHPYGHSLCVSSEVGCNMGCQFCASGLLKKERGLAVSELVLQLLSTMALTKTPITSVVVMGTGEPFTNFTNLMTFIKIINDPLGFNIGARKITISTCGITPKIKAFADHNTQVNLALSLHAANDTKRNQIMPINRQYPLTSVFEALDYYLAKTRRRVTLEYVMLDNFNTSLTDAKMLLTLIGKRNVYLNLIPYNEVKEFPFKRASQKTIMNFYNFLKQAHVDVTIRKEHGTNINGACGQLRAQKVQNESNHYPDNK